MATQPSTTSNWWQDMSPEEQTSVLDQYKANRQAQTTNSQPVTNPINGQVFPAAEPYADGAPQPPSDQIGASIWNPTGTEPDPMDFDTRAPNPGAVPEFDWYAGDSGPNVVTQNPQSANNNTMTVLNPDGSVTPGVVDPTTRDVMPEELVENRLSNLLRSDSKLIQDARRQGMEQANALGGLGGTVGAGASMQAAMRTALPIAESDANAYRAAAAQNMEALNAFAMKNHERATQLEMAQIDSRTRQLTTQIQTSASMAAAMLESATQRDLGRLDSETRLRLQEMQGKISDRLQTSQFQYDALLKDAEYAAELAKTMMQGEFGLAGTGLQGQWNAEIQEQMNEVNREQQYITAVTSAYDSYSRMITDINGTEGMDQPARDRAIASAKHLFDQQMILLGRLFPGFAPIVTA